MFAVYFVLALISPKSMGMGDVKLALVIGLLLGWFGLNAWLIGLLAAFIVGGLIAIVALLLRRVTLKGSIPFGPSMLAGALIALLVVGPSSASGSSDSSIDELSMRLLTSPNWGCPAEPDVAVICTGASSALPCCRLGRSGVIAIERRMPASFVARRI